MSKFLSHGYSSIFFLFPSTLSGQCPNVVSFQGFPSSATLSEENKIIGQDLRDKKIDELEEFMAEDKI